MQELSVLGKKRAEWVLVFFWLVFIAADIATKFYYSPDPCTATESQLFRDWLMGFIRFVSLVMASSSTIIFGIHRIRRDGYSHRRLILPAFVVGFLIFIAGTALFGYRMVAEVQRTHLKLGSEDFLSSLEEDLSLEYLSPELRSQLSEMYAKQLYIVHGRTEYYVTLNGTKKLYEPTDQEKEYRWRNTCTKELLDRARKATKRAIIIWPIVALLSIAIGMFSPVHKKGSAKKPDMNT